MDPSEFCLVNHIHGDSSIHLRFCISCKKAMCGACHAAHKDTCEEIPSSERPKDKQMDISYAPSGRRNTDAPPGLRTNTRALPDKRENTSMPPRKKVRSARGKKAKYGSDDSQNSDFTKCSFHSVNEEYFCLSHCLIVCDKCVDESHGTCTVKLITDTCKDLSHKYVCEYKKWLNNLIIDCIDKQRVLTKNIAGLDIQKQSALNQLNEEYLKISDRLEVEMRKAKNEILKEHENHKAVLTTSISRIEAIVARLKTSFKETNILEGRNLDVCLFQKFQQILFENIDLPSELESLDNSLRKIQMNFKGDKRYQPLSNNPKFGSVCVTTTKINADPLPNLNFPFELPKSYEQPRSQRRKQPKTLSKISEVTGTPKASKTKRTIDSASFAIDQCQEPGANMKEGTIKLNNETQQSNCSLEQISSCSDIVMRIFKGNNSIDTNQSVSRIECHGSTPAQTTTEDGTIKETRASMVMVNCDQDTRQRTNFNSDLASSTPNKQENEPQLSKSSVQPHEKERDNFFFRKLQLFSQCHDYTDLELKVKEADPEIMQKWGDISIKKNINLIDGGLIHDTDAANTLRTALYKLPDELNGRVPVRVKGDGNCLSRSGSILAFGTEEHFAEIRCRIIIELVQNKKEYLSLSHINQCVDLSLKKPENLLKTYCMYSEQYKPGSKTNEANIEHVFEKEVMSICRDKTFMGIWHLFGLSSVLHSQMFSVYPYLGNSEIYHSLNRFIQPIDNRCDNVLCAIAWTTTIRDMTPINWKPNHFVPLIPISKPPQGNAEVRNTFDDTEFKSTSEASDISSLVAAYLPESPDTSKYCGRKSVNVSGTRLDTAATIRARACMSVLNGEHDTSKRTNLNNGNAVEDSPNVNARKALCSNLKHQSGQIGINHANSSAQRNSLKNQTEDGRRENISYMPLLSKEIANNNVHTSGFTGIKVTDRGHQDSLSQPLYAYANIPFSVNDMSVSQAGLWNSSSHRNQNSAMTDTYVKKELNINPSSFSGNSLPIQKFQQAETLLPSSQSGLGNTSFQNTVLAQRNRFAMTDTHVTKDLHVIPINYSINSLPTQNVQQPPTLMSRNINGTIAIQTNRLFLDSCSTSQNQSATINAMSFHNMSASKCFKYNIRVDDDQHNPCRTGLSVTSDGRILLVDCCNKNVKMLSQNREKISFLNVNGYIRDVTVYNDTTAVVTGSFKLFFIDISGSELRMSKSIKTTSDPSGIQTCNKNFLVTSYDCKAVKLITENGVVLWSVSKDREGRPLFSEPAYITCFQDGNQCRVVVSDVVKHTLTVLDGDSGEVINVCEVKRKGPVGVTADNTGNIYVCYHYTREIAIWDKDMANSRILTNTNGYPWELGFDASRNQLIVSYDEVDYVEIFQLK